METTKGHRQAEKAARLVDYLLRLATLRMKLIHDIAEYERVLWVSSVPHERGCFTQAWGRDEEHEPDEWLEVQNRREPEAANVAFDSEVFFPKPSNDEQRRIMDESRIKLDPLAELLNAIRS